MHVDGVTHITQPRQWTSINELMLINQLERTVRLEHREERGWMTSTLIPRHVEPLIHGIHQRFDRFAPRDGCRATGMENCAVLVRKVMVDCRTACTHPCLRQERYRGMLLS